VRLMAWCYSVDMPVSIAWHNAIIAPLLLQKQLRFYDL
jgi:hypothetical protein